MGVSMVAWYLRNAAFLLASWTLLWVILAFLGGFLLTSDLGTMQVYLAISRAAGIVQIILALTVFIHGLSQRLRPSTNRT